jgi:GNAT superfamily N-acetyltransferase
VKAKIRPATEEDLAQTWDIWRETEVAVADGDQPPPVGSEGALALHRHELESGEMAVAEVGGRVVGFAAAITRGPVRFLSELYVRPDVQSSGIGKALLERVLPPGAAHVSATLSSDDERALSLYVRHGMQPQWPFFYLKAESAGLKNLSDSSLEIVEAEAGDAALLKWDRGICGRERPQDHAYWVKAVDAVPVWFKREGHTAGYGYFQMRSDESLWYPEALTIGPMGARTIDDARDCALAAMAWARERSDVLRIAVPGPHPALAPLLEVGFRITDMDVFVSTGSGMFVDPRRYVPSGGSLF